ncbi:MAG: GspH/FimT family pseudopilin [Syntrophales bacterium]|jgi:type IV fimbrial biogenesis protein FimT|nr:GspH/FimT family pseudopilin [Syntrophales bacterium]HQP29028.1 GspH/FimT family pseudopilin [Syntrophales bacterium]
MRRKIHRGGFSLVELIIVVAIMAILSTLAVPSLQTYMAQRRLNGAARLVMSDLMNARMLAVTQNRNVQVSFPTSAAATYTYDATSAALSRNIQTGFDYHDVTVAAATSPTFVSSGRLSNTVGIAIALASSTLGRTKTVSVNTSGRVAIE